MSFLTRAHLAVSSFYLPRGHNSKLLNVEVLLFFVQSTAGASLLANASPLTLMASPLSVTSQNVTSAPLTPFGMLGGLVPVTVPFQFPLELLGFGTDTAGVTTTSGSTSAAFHHSLTQSEWNSLSHCCMERGILKTEVKKGSAVVLR